MSCSVQRTEHDTAVKSDVKLCRVLHHAVRLCQPWLWHTARGGNRGAVCTLIANNRSFASCKNVFITHRSIQCDQEGSRAGKKTSKRSNNDCLHTQGALEITNMKIIESKNVNYTATEMEKV